MVLYRDNTFKFTQLYRFSDRERYLEIKEDLLNLLNLGVQIESITSDGHKAILKAVREALPDAVQQRCLVHIQRDCRIWLTKNPKSFAGYDLKKIHDSVIEDKFELDDYFMSNPPSDKDPEVNPTTLINKLINRDLYNSIGIRTWKSYLGYSHKYKSLTISLLKEGEVQTVAIRESNGVKWRTYGSKTYIPYRIDDDFVFLFSGMAEVLLMDLFGLSYIQLQADGMVKHLPTELKELCKDKTVIVLQDNDDTFKAIVPEIRSFFNRSEVVVVDFEVVLNTELKHGYDFRDYCNQVKDPKKVMQMIETEIIVLQDKSYVR